MKRSPLMLGALSIAMLTALLAGCQGPRPISGNVQVDLPDEEAYRQFWSHSLSSVRHFGYELERTDPAAGVIVSEPEVSKQWFEFWRRDTLGSEQVAEASLHTIRRQVQVAIARTPDTNEYIADVRVNVQRMSQPERQVTTPSSAVNAFNDRLPTERPVSEAEARRYWVDLGRDRVLETAILQRLTRYPNARIVASDNGEAPTTQQATQPAMPTEEPIPQPPQSTEQGTAAPAAEPTR